MAAQVAKDGLTSATMSHIAERSGIRSTLAPELKGTGAAPVTDPVCEMAVDPVSALERRDIGTAIVYFCSAHCAAAYDADPGHHAAAVAGTVLAADAE